MRIMQKNGIPGTSVRGKKIYILLTRLRSRWAKAVGVLTGEFYTHASLGFEEDLQTFYSFTFKGFLVESIKRYIEKNPGGVKCMLYELWVSQEEYESLKAEIAYYISNRKRYHYNRIGVILSLFHISWKRQEHYFCSQFVAELLQKREMMTTKKKSTIFFPKDFHRVKELKPYYCGNLSGMLQLCAVTG